MPVDMDTQGFWQWLLGAAGIGAGGYKVVTHEMRLTQLEKHRENTVDPQLKTLGEGFSGIESKLDGVAEGVKTIQDLLVKKGLE